MPEVEQRLGKVEERLDAVEHAVEGLRGEVGGLRGEVGGLRDEVLKLRVLGEDNARDIQLLREGHGARFDAIDKALEPLARLDDFVRRVASDHEDRIQALEKRAGVPE